jgi:hypothetical protein
MIRLPDSLSVVLLMGNFYFTSKGLNFSKPSPVNRAAVK